MIRNFETNVNIIRKKVLKNISFTIFGYSKNFGNTKSCNVIKLNFLEVFKSYSLHILFCLNKKVIYIFLEVRKWAFDAKTLPNVSKKLQKMP
jgi:hypothetical protein